MISAAHISSGGNVTIRKVTQIFYPLEDLQPTTISSPLHIIFFFLTFGFPDNQEPSGNPFSSLSVAIASLSDVIDERIR